MSELRDRAHGNEPTTGGEVAKTDPRAEAVAHATQLVRKMQGEFSAAMPAGAEAAQLVRDAVTMIRQNPGLAECDGQSLLGGLMTLAQLGLRPGVLGQGWLIPFRDKHARGGVRKAQLVVGYKGFVALGYRSNQVAGISARTVHANDPFDIAYGSEDRLYHKPLLTGDRGIAIGYYCVVHIKDGRPIFHYMTRPEMEAHRDKYAMAQKDGQVIPGTPWAEQFEQMAHKTCLRQLASWMPQSTELQTALAVDNGFRIDPSRDARPEDATYHVEQVATGNEEGNA